MRTVAIIQARSRSERLPGKVLLEINGRTMLQLVVERVKRARSVDLVVIATTTHEADDRIEALARELGVPVYRGSEHDLLSRYHGAASAHDAELVVRITADCPLISPRVIDKVVGRYMKRRPDYALAISREGNPLGYPRGTNVEVLSFKILGEINCLAKSPEHREHVGIYLEEHPERYAIEWVEAEEHLRRPGYRLTVDEAEDWELIKKIYMFFPEGKFISLADAVRVLDENPEYRLTNLAVRQKGYSEDLNGRKPNSTVVFRADANYELGTGHLKRSLALAEELKKLRYDPVFLANEDRLVDRMIGERHPVVHLPAATSTGEAISRVRKEMFELAPVATIVDLRNPTHAELLALKQYSGLLVDISGESQSDLYSDVIVKGDVGLRVNRGPYADYYVGSQYKLLGNDCTASRKKRRKPRKEIGDILVSMGGTDPSGLTVRTVRALLDTGARITVVAGPGFGKRKELLDSLKGQERVVVVESPDNLCELLVGADICYISGGVTLYEAVCLGTPPVVLCQNRSQLHDARAIARLGACVCLGIGKRVSLRAIRNSLAKLRDIRSRERMRAIGMKMVDGLGSRRIARAVDARVRKTRGRTVLVIGSGREQVPLIKAARAMGCRVVSVDGNIDAPGFPHSDSYHVVDTGDLDSIRVIAKKYRIDGVITSTESGVESAASISRERKLPGVTRAPEALAPDKLRVKELLLKHNVPTSRYRVVTSLAEAVRASRDLSLPVIFKPCDNAGGRGVVTARKLNEVDHAYACATGNTKQAHVLVEQYLPGRELGCEAFLHRGELQFIVFTDKLTSREPYGVVMGHTIPSAVTDRLEAEAIAAVERCVRALKIENGPVNCDIILTKDGPRVIDVGCRLGGNRLPLLAYLSRGVNTYREAVRAALGITPDLKPRLRFASAMCYLRPKPGVVQSISGVDTVGKIDGLALFEIQLKPGDIVREVTHVSHRVGFFVATAPSLGQLKSTIGRIRRAVHIKTAPLLGSC